MRFNYRAQVLLALACLLVACCLCLSNAQTVGSAAAADLPAAELTTRPETDDSGGGGGKPKLFRILDFGRFKRLFRKSYASWVEEMARSRIYLAKCYRAFVSALQFKQGQRSSYKSINHMSDWTSDEFRATLMRPEAMRRAHEGAAAADEAELRAALREESEQEEALRRAAESEAAGIGSERDVERKMVEAAKQLAAGQRVGDASLSELAEHQAAGESSRRKREVAVVEQSQLPEASVADLMGGVLAQVDRLEHRDEYQDESNTSDLDEPVPLVGPIGAQLVGAMAGASDGGSGGGSGGNLSPTKKKGRRRVTEKETVYLVDHRNCFPEPVDQRKCGSCYIFAAISVLEFHYCRSTGERVKFSEQFPLDCSENGCGGGMSPDVVDFSVEYGVDLAKTYPYFERRKKCHFGKPIADPKSSGYLRLGGLKKRRVDYVDFAQALESGPILFYIPVTGDFSDYGGGVDELKCGGEDDLHAMVLVGHGRENNKDFWLVRNSYSADWGEGGYYKVTKRSFKKCYEDSEWNGYLVEGNVKFRRNRKYDAQMMEKLSARWWELLEKKREAEEA